MTSGIKAMNTTNIANGTACALWLSMAAETPKYAIITPTKRLRMIDMMCFAMYTCYSYPANARSSISMTLFAI